MYRVIEAPPHLSLELDVETLQYKDLQFIHSDEMEHLQSHFYQLEGFMEHAHQLKLKRVQELKKKEHIPEGEPEIIYGKNGIKIVRYINRLLTK
jgi:hypothetical protein